MWEIAKSEQSVFETKTKIMAHIKPRLKTVKEVALAEFKGNTATLLEDKSTRRIRHFSPVAQGVGVRRTFTGRPVATSVS